MNPSRSSTIARKQRRSKPIRIVVQVEDGCISRILSSDPSVSVEILDMDDNGEIEEHEAGIARDAELDADVAAGKLHEID